MRKHAERCTTNHVHLHIARQRNLGERMIGDHDKPRRIELVVCAALLVALVTGCAAYYFNWNPALFVAGCFS